MFLSRMTFAWAVVVLAATNLSAQPEEQPPWVEPMRKVHAKFDGNEKMVVQFGDSITHSLAFWSPMGWSDPAVYLSDDKLPKQPENKPWKQVIDGVRLKGREHGNYSGWKVGNLVKVIDQVLKQHKPSVAIVMIGTNDIAGGKVPSDYRKNLSIVLTKCLDANCIPILNTIPPRRGRDQAVAGVNKIVHELAEKLRIPLVDYHAEIVTRQPNDSCFGTLISNDGVHPSGGENHVYTEENLKQSGYALRNWVNFLRFRQIYFWILTHKQ